MVMTLKSSKKTPTTVLFSPVAKVIISPIYILYITYFAVFNKFLILAVAIAKRAVKLLNFVPVTTTKHILNHA